MMKKTLLLAVAAVVCTGLLAQTSKGWPGRRHPQPLRPAGIYTLAMVGDILTGTTFPENRLPENGGKMLFCDADSLLQGADLAMGNLEGPVCEGGVCAKNLAAGGRYAFRMPPEHAFVIKQAGFDFVSIANNHIHDFGDDGISATMRTLEEAGLGFAGVPDAGCWIREVRGRKIGVCAFGHNGYTLMHTDSCQVDSVIIDLRTKCDILVVSFHGGAEGGVQGSHVPYGKEMFMGENRGSLRELAHRCIDLGADVVFGHGPHVPRAVEVYKNRFIAYSLGNFCTPYGISLKGKGGYAPLVTVALDATGRFLSGRIHSFVQVYGQGPRLDITNQAARLIRSLTEEDMPDRSFTISDDGEIRNL